MKQVTVCLLVLALVLGTFTGCKKNTTPEKVNSIDFTIVTEADLPEELQELIKERKEVPFQLTFSDQACLYIVRGYGKQPSGGYNIKINDFYETESSLYLDTELFGPKDQKNLDERATYPYIVIKTEFRKQPVEFS